MRDPLVGREGGVGEHELADDLVDAQVALDSHGARVAERAREAASDLGREAERQPIVVRHQHRMDSALVGEPEDELLAAVSGGYDALDGGQVDPGSLPEALTKLLR